MNKPNQPSESVRKLNPHLFGPESCVNTAYEMLKSHKLVKQSDKPLMNKLETDFFGQLKRFGWKVILCQSVKLRLANGTWYCPDFITFGNPDDKPLVVWEVKGKHIWEDSIVKLKVAAHQYNFGEWRLAHRYNGQWGYQIVLP